MSLVKYKLSSQWPEFTSFVESIPASQATTMLCLALAVYVMVLTFQKLSSLSSSMFSLMSSYLWTMTKVSWLWWSRSKVTKPSHIYHSSRMVYGESRMYLSTLVNGKEVRVKIPIELQANAGSRIRQSTAELREMAMPVLR